MGLLPRWLLISSVMEQSVQEDAIGMACIVLPQLLTVHMLPRRLLLPRWLLTNSVMELSAQGDAVHMLDGTAAQMVCTVLPLLLTVHMPKITFRNLLQE